MSSLWEKKAGISCGQGFRNDGLRQNQPESNFCLFSVLVTLSAKWYIKTASFSVKKKKVFAGDHRMVASIFNAITLQTRGSQRVQRHPGLQASSKIARVIIVKPSKNKICHNSPIPLRFFLFLALVKPQYKL